MRRPSFQFYPADWLGNSNLRRCTHAEKGAWVDVMCLMHDSQEYGLLRWPLIEIAQAVGCQADVLKALISKGVMKGADAGECCEAFVYVPRSGRKDGDPVTLIPEQPGPVWYSSRMVRDEYVREHRGEASRFASKESAPGEAPNETPKARPKDAPKPPFGVGLDAHPTDHPTLARAKVIEGATGDQQQKQTESAPEAVNSNGFGNIHSPMPPFGDGSSSSSSASSSKREAGKPPAPHKVTFSTWLETIKASGERAVSDYKPVWNYARNIGLPDDMVSLAWRQFRRRYQSDPVYRSKRYTDWRKVFLNAIEQNWFKLWVAVDDGYRLTTQGLQAQREHEAEASVLEVVT